MTKQEEYGNPVDTDNHSSHDIILTLPVKHEADHQPIRRLRICLNCSAHKPFVKISVN